MTTNNKQIAIEILNAIGGPDNITSAAHCMTRLRLNLKDQSIPNDSQIKSIKGVLNAQWSGGQYQVIIGQNVSKVYDEFIKLGVNGAGAIDENLDDNVSKNQFNLRTFGQNVLSYLSRSMIQLIPVMMVAALFRTVGAICGPTMLNIWPEGSATYNLFYNWLYNAGFYFMPIILGWSACRTLGANPVLGMMLGGVLLAPDLMNIVNSGETTTIVYGLPAVANNYSNTVLPILLCVPVLYQVEKFFKKVIPDLLSTMLVPFLTMAVMVPVSLCVLAPLGSVLGNLLGTFLFGLGNIGGLPTILTIVIVGALWEFLVMTGMHQVLIALAMANMATGSPDSCIMVAAVTASFACYGMSLGAFLRLKNPDAKAENMGFLISAVIGGVTEPVLYGLGFKYMRTFLGLIAGGAAGSLVAGALGLDIYVVSNASFLAFFGYVAGGIQNIIAGAISMAVAIIVATIVTYFFGFSKEELNADRATANSVK